MGTFPGRNKLVTLEDAAKLVKDGDMVLCGGEFQARTPTAFIRELVRQRKRNLYFIGHASGFIIDLACGGGIVGEVDATRVSFERELGFAPNYRRAAERGRIKVKDTCCPVIDAQLRASAYGVPFLPVAGHVTYTSMLDLHPEYRVIDCPFTGEKVVLVPKLKPDVVLIHAHRADPAGNWEIEHESFHDYLYVRAAEKVIVTAEEIVSNEEMRSRGLEFPACFPPRFPYFKTTAVVHVPLGAHPASCYPKYTYDKEHLTEYLDYAMAGPEKFQEYLDKYVYGCRTHEEYIEKIGTQRLRKLTSWRSMYFEFQKQAGARAKIPSVDEYSVDELMSVCLARCVEDGDVAVHGGDSYLPMVALRLAKLTHAPNMVHIGGLTGSINPEPPFLPRNTNDVWYYYGAELTYPFMYVLDLYQRGEIDVMFFGGVQIDKYGNVNSNFIGSKDNIKVKLAGGGGTCNIMGSVRKTVLWTTNHHRPKGHYTLVDKVDFITGHGHLPGKETKEIGPYKVVTDLGIFGFDEKTKIMKLEALYPDVTVDDILNNTEFKPVIPEEVPVVNPPTAEEIDILRRVVDPTDVRKMEFTAEQLKRKFRMSR